ncbi:MAG: hypothetical protein IMY84_01860 [Chloroflexi bacterium]|nr:hypothetical protein [Chloroflexota bacterium]
MRRLPSFAIPLSIAVGILVAVASFSGLFIDATYASEATSFATQGRAQDLVNLVWVLPLFGIAVYHIRRGLFSARIGWLGILLYFTYTYLLASMGLAYNRLFLVYVAIYGLSLALLIVGLGCIRYSDMHWRFSHHFPRRATAMFVIAMGTSVALLWLGDIVPSLVYGTPPPQLAEAVSQSLVVQALDLGIVVPLSIIGGVTLLRRMAVGYLLTGLALAKAVTLGPALLSMAAFLTSAGLAVAPPMLIFAGLVTGFGTYLAFRYVRSLA